MTSEREREAILVQNEAIRDRYRDEYPKLRRCLVCLGSGCASRACRVERQKWCAEKWTAELQREYMRRNPDALIKPKFEGTGPNP